MTRLKKMWKITKVSALSLLLLITNITFLPQNISAYEDDPEPNSLFGDIGTLALVRNENGVDVDIKDMDKVPMSISRDNKYTFNIKAEFNAGDEKKINVYVPTGYKIVRYSATESTPNMDGVEKIKVDDTYKQYVNSSVLTAASTGSMTSQIDEKYGNRWNTQRINGFYRSFSRTETSIHAYGGDIEYTFNKNTTKVELVFELQLQQHILPHLTVDNDVLEPVKVVMSSKNAAGEKAELSTSFQGVAINNTSLMLKYSGLMGGSVSYNVGADINSPDGLSEQFPIIWENSIYNSEASQERNYFSDEVTYTIKYPEGVYFDNHMLIRQLFLYKEDNGDLLPLYINDEKLITQDNVTYTSINGKYCNFKPEDKTDCHFEVQIDENEQLGGGTIVLKFYKIGIQHQLENGVYFKADTKKYPPSNPVIKGFSVTSQAKRNGQLNTPYTQYYERTLAYYDGNHKDITITPVNSHRRDFDSYYENYKYDYALGGFQLEPKFSYPNNHMVFDFDTEKIGVRGVSLPGKNIRNIEALTTKGRTLRIANIYETSNNVHGVMISPEELGLEDGEYIDIFKATVDLQQILYSDYYTDGGCSYMGTLFDTTENEIINSASLQIVDDNGNIMTNSQGKQLFSNDTITVHWNNTGVLQVESSVDNLNDPNLGNVTAYPNQILAFESTVTPGETWRTGQQFHFDKVDADTIVDPVTVISLPYGVSLDRESVKAVSVSGNYKGAEFPLKQIGDVEYITKNGVRWSIYKFTSLDELDMIARERTYWSYRDQRQLEYAPTGITVKFNAVVDPHASLLNLDVNEIIKWDLNKTAYNSNGVGNFISYDWYNELGHGADYCYARNEELKFSIKPLTGLVVELGIKEKGSDDDFQNFNGTDDSVVKVGLDQSAQVKLSYLANTNTTFSAGTSLYLPIPKKGMDYTKYFENIELEKPLENEINKKFQFTTELENVPVLNALDNNGTTWTTYYAIGTLKSNEADYVAGDETWEPVVDSNNGAVLWVKASDYTGDLKDVVMLKFVADTPIVSDGTGECFLDLKLLNDGNEDIALEELVDYWRTYNKILDQNDAKTGIWDYSNPIAVSPYYHGFLGIFFVDKDRNGNFDYGNIGSVDELYNPGIPANDQPANILVTLKNHSQISEIPLAFTEIDGHKVIKLDRLTNGTYTITLHKSDSNIGYSRHHGKNPSSSIQINNDLRDIEDDVVASYTFTVTDDQRDYYAGFGLEEKVNVSYEVTGDIFPDNSSELPGKELLEYGTAYDQKAQLTTTDPSFTFLGWYTDKNCTEPFVNGTQIVKDTVLYGKWSTKQVHVNYEIVGEKPADAKKPDSVTLDYGTEYNQEGKPETNDESYDFFGWFTDKECTIPYDNGTKIIEDTTLYGKYVKKQVNVSYEITGKVRPDENSYTYFPGKDQFNYGLDYTVSGPAAVTGTRYTFHGWYLTKDCQGQPVTELKNVTHDTTLYGYWTINPVHVSYEVVGDVHPDKYTVPAMETLQEGTEYNQKGEPATDEKGFVFHGWFTDKECKYPYMNGTAIFDDTVLYGKYTVKELKVNYHVIGDLPNDGTRNPYDEEKVLYNKTYTAKDSLTTTDINSGVQYVFNGWYDNPELTGKRYTSSNLTQDLDLYGEWVKFADVNYKWVSTDNPTDVTVPSGVQDILVGTEYKSTPQSATSQPYVFKGWYTDEACTTEYVENTKLEKNLTLYGKWVKQVNVTYVITGNIEPEDASPVPGRKDFDYGTIYNKENKLTTSDKKYSFIGWYLDEEFTKEFKDGTPLTEDLVFYGKWAVNQVNVSYEVIDNGTRPGKYTTPEGSTFDYGKSYTVSGDSTTEEAGYVFDGWYFTKECTGNKVTEIESVTEDTVLYGKYTKKQVNVSYEVVGDVKPDNSSEVPGKETFDYGTKYDQKDQLTTTSKGYTFSGWFTDSQCTKPYMNGTSIIEDTVLYGKWMKDKVNVTYVVVGDVKPDNSSEVPAQKEFDFGTVYNQEKGLTTTDKGYTFSGWYIDPECTTLYQDGMTLEENLVLYGYWEKDKVNVSYKVVGDIKPDQSSEIPGNKTFDYGTVYTSEDGLTTTSKGYHFKGWFIDPECKIPYVESELTKDIVLYGKWERDKVTIDYEVLGDKPEDYTTPDSDEIYLGDRYNQAGPSVSEDDSYVFEGWFTDKECTKPYVDGTELDKDLILYGKWTKKLIPIEPGQPVEPQTPDVPPTDAQDQSSAYAWMMLAALFGLVITKKRSMSK